jgi:hypothetical protein
MLPVTAAWLADRAGRDKSAGVWAGVAIYVKPFLAGLIVYWIWRREWRRLTAALLAAGAMTLVGAVLAGPASYVAWGRSMSLGPAPYAPLNASLLGLWSRTFIGSEFAPALFPQPRYVLLIAWGISLVALVWTMYRNLAADHDADRAWALVSIGSIAASAGDTRHAHSIASTLELT